MPIVLILQGLVVGQAILQGLVVGQALLQGLVVGQALVQGDQNLRCPNC